VADVADLIRISVDLPGRAESLQRLSSGSPAMRRNLPITDRVVEIARDAILSSTTDPKGRILEVNDDFVHYSGFERAELIGQAHNIVRHPDMPEAVFDDMWKQLKAGRCWRGLVKNRCKNGDHYWVDALIVPVRKHDQTVGYMSVRTAPSREQIAAAEALYQKLNAGSARLPQPGAWARLSLRTKFGSLVGILLAAQLLGALFHLLGDKIGLSVMAVDLTMQGMGVASIAAGILLFVLQGRIFDTTDRLSLHLDRIAQGDLTEAIPLSRVDELGRLNDNVVTMQTHIKAMLAEVAEAADSVRQNADRLNQQMQETHRVSITQSEAAERIAASVEQLAASVEEVATHAHQTADAALASRETLTGASDRMEESRAASRNVVSTVNGAGRTMSELFQSIFAIGQVTSTIQGIAEQTNLLALNAAIEAARAGESGRGFAVVADEVRKLAERSRLATEEITSSVQEIQSKTQTAVTNMETAGAQVAETDTAMDKAHDGLGEVARQEALVVDMSQQIAAVTRQQSTVGEEIAHQVEDIVQGIERTSGAIADIKIKAGEMLGVSDKLRELVGYFRFIR